MIVAHWHDAPFDDFVDYACLKARQYRVVTDVQDMPQELDCSPVAWQHDEDL